MKPPTEKQAALEIIEVLAEVFDNSPASIRLRPAAGSDEGYDFSVSLAGHRFLVAYKASASLGPLAVAIDRLKRSGEDGRRGRRLLISVPYMGPVGQELCAKLGVSWLDLSGNAKVVAPGLRILIGGRPNKYRDRGRPSNAFASKSSRVARQLLLWPQRFQTQAELARQTGLDDGYVSKVVRRLAQEQLIDANDEGAVRALIQTFCSTPGKMPMTLSGIVSSKDMSPAAPVTKSSKKSSNSSRASMSHMR